MTGHYHLKNKMKPSMAASLLLLVLLSGSIASSSAGVLEDLCNNLGGFYIRFPDCMSRLGADRRSRTSKDVPALAVISLDLCTAGAARINTNLEKLIADPKFAPVRKSLNICHTLYSNVAPAVRATSDAVTSRRYADAQKAFASVFTTAADCDKAFDQDGSRNLSPISKENGDFSGLAALANAIVSTLNR